MRTILPLLMLASLLVGCASGKSGGAGYSTVAQDPRRDAERAQRLDAEGVRLIKAGKYIEAEQVLKKALEADVTYGPAHNNLGTAYYRQGKYYLAAWEFQYATRLMPHHKEPFNNLGLVLEEVEKLTEAQEHYGRALALEPEDPQLIGNLARAKVRRGDRDPELRDLLVKLIERDTRPEWVQWAREQLAALPAEE